MALYSSDSFNIDSKEILQIKCASFEYLLAGVANEYSKLNDYPNIKTFNECNDLNSGNSLVYPFFVAISNGYSKALYSLFGKFISFSFGPASISIYDLISSPPSILNRGSALKFFTLSSTINKVGIQVLNETRFEHFDDLKKAILEETVDLENGSSVRFSEIKITGDENGEKFLYDAIDYGIDRVKDKFSDTFFDGHRKSILAEAQYFKAFQNAYIENKSAILDYGNIEEDKKKIFYAEAVVPA